MIYYKPCAKNHVNNKRIQEQKLNKKEYVNRKDAFDAAIRLAEKMNERGGNWTPFVRSYSKK